MNNFKNILILISLILLSVLNNAWASALKDVSGYHVLAAGSWANSAPGTCSGITFPATVTSQIPDAGNEIEIDANLIKSTYSCSTVYKLDNNGYVGKCLVGIEVIVQNGQIVKVNLSASKTSPLSYSVCQVPENSPFVIMQINPPPYNIN